VRALFDRGALERELDAELRFHLECEAERHERAGLSRDDALRRARAEFGRLDRVKERAAARAAPLRSRWCCTTSGSRATAPAGARLRCAVVLVLALGIGATTAAFAVVDAVLLKPLPYPRSDRLVRLTHTASLAGRSTVDQSDATVLLYQRHAAAFDGVAAWWADNVDANIEPSAPGETPARARIARVTANLLDVLRVRPALGRGFEPGEDRAGAARVVLLSDRLWRERYHGDRGVIGRQILVNEVPRTIVGVMPRASRIRRAPWISGSRSRSTRPPRRRHASGSSGSGGCATASPWLRPAPTWRARSRGCPTTSRTTGRRACSRRRTSCRTSSRCATPSSVARRASSGCCWRACCSCSSSRARTWQGLFLVRAEHAQVELAVRGALGAGARALTTQALAESVLLSVAGGALGVLLALVGLRRRCGPATRGRCPASTRSPSTPARSRSRSAPRCCARCASVSCRCCARGGCRSRSCCAARDGGPPRIRRASARATRSSSRRRR
jgi:hypothetical protein